MGRSVGVAVGAGLALALACTALAQAPTSSTRPAPAAAWLKAPSSDEIAEAMPARARAEGVSGAATLRCALTRSGGVEQCAVASEQPVGYGFGAAALRLADSFRTAPRAEGRTVAGEVVLIPLVFRNFDAQGRTQVALVTNPHWRRTPTPAEMKAAYPAQAAGVPGGKATVRCDFQPTGQTRSCVVRSQEPAGLGFGEAAEKLAHGFVIAARPLDSAVLQLVNADIPFTFRNPAGGAQSQAVEPQWTRMLTAAGAERLFPAMARAAKVNSGVARIDCAGTAAGDLVDCKVVSEEPAGLGFGAAAIAAAGQISMNPWAAGEPVEGRRITLPIQLVMQGGAKP